MASLASQTGAQLEERLPDTPPAEGQTLLKWVDPPVLTYTIPEDRRGDLSSCANDFEYDLLSVAATCWPVLEALKLYTRADYAFNEPTGDKLENMRATIGYANATLELIGKPEYPLEEFLRSKALERKLGAHEKLGQWEAALATSKDWLETLRGDLMRGDDFSRAFAHTRHGDALLRLGRSQDARDDLEVAIKLFDGIDGDKVGWPLSNYSENVIKDALRKGDLDYAEHTIDRYLEFVREEPRGLRFGIHDHLDLKLYLVAARGDREQALALIEERMERRSNRPQRCSGLGVLFPAVLAPLRRDKDVTAALKAHGCGEEDFAQMENAANRGLRGFKDELILPYREATKDSEDAKGSQR
ncbi:MAG: hypothetical protein QNI87_14550 [Erythrobacter sp.]|uniref:hypothetical protein n=1 Tax=Erythrobacter sp. TaxID=1042 RepID=UPI00262D50D7|nr:hypothetical protein [Erythrobacter sp.]MDJ0979741.1 hypothetical protein [Erythrobacter sp.]